MIARVTTRLILALSFLASSATAGDFPFAKGTFDADGKLKQWKLEDVRIHCDKAIGDLAGRNSVMEKDDAADPLLIAYLSDAVEDKTFETILDLSDIQGLVHVAIQVDDHATLTVKEIPNSIQPDGHTPIDQTYELIGTALWNKGRSYKEFPTPIPAGRKYNLKLDYRNTDNLTKQYDGLIDFDGVNVFLMHDPAVDLDVDSNNNEGFVFTWGSPEEDRIEASLDYDQPGKIIAVPLDPDADKDGVPDALDGFDGRGDTLGDTQFVQMVVSLPPDYDPETAKVTFAYKMSTLGMTEGATHNESGFRIWTHDAFVRRSTNAIPEAKTETGYLVRKDEEISWKKLAAHCDPAASHAYPGPAVILYIETVLVSDANGLISSMPFATKEPISVTAKPNDQDAQLNTSDTVNIAVRCTGGVKLTGPDAIVVNDNDDNNNEQWDKAEDNLELIDADVKPIKIKAVALDQPVTVTISSEAMKTAGDTGTSTAGGLIGGFYPGLKTTTPGATTGSDSDGQSKIGRISVPYTFTVPANTTITQNLFIDGQRNSATMEDVVIEATIDSSGIEAGTPPCAATTMAEHKLTVYQIDLDIDSNNNEGFTFTDGSSGEDAIEASIDAAKPGKIIVTGVNRDSDNDGVPDYADGMGLPPVAGSAPSSGACGVATRLVPFILKMPTPIDLDMAEVTFEYDASIPRLDTAAEAGDIKIIPPNAAFKTPRYSVKSGFRIWTCDAKGRPDDTQTAGDIGSDARCKFVPKNKKIKWSDLLASAGSASGTRAITLYLEYVESGLGIATFPGKYNIKVEASDGIGESKDEICVTAVAMQVKEVSFSGGKNWTLVSDDTTITYSAPHWSDMDNDGTAEKNFIAAVPPSEHNYPIAYTRNTTPEVKAKFALYGLPAGYSMKAKALTNIASGSVSGTLEFSERALIKNSSGLYEYDKISANGTLENKVQFYNTPYDPGFAYPGPGGAVVNSFQLDWAATLSTIPTPTGGPAPAPDAWTDANNSDHTLYVTLGDPQTALRQETLFNIACRRAHGMQTEDEVVDGIWDEFTHRIVSRVHHSTGIPNRDLTGMIYWKLGGNGHVPVAQLLIDGNGSCGTWQDFFLETARTQGHTKLQGITVDAPVPRDHATNYPTAINDYRLQFPMTNGVRTNGHYLSPGSAGVPHGALANDVYLMPIKNADDYGAFFVKTCNLTLGKFYKITDWTAPISCQISSPAQGNPGIARGYFGNHAIVSYTPTSTGKSRYYDPSYGGALVDDPDRKTKYEDSAFQAYGAFFMVISFDASKANWNANPYVWYERDNPSGTKECEFTPP
jgi:hypothetical protein